MDLCFVKLGGSVITDKTQPYTLREGVLDRLCAELREALDERRVQLLVGHGAGSFPHHSASRFQTHRGLVREDSVRGLCEVSRDVFRLNRLVIEALLAAGVSAMPFQPSAGNLSEGGTLQQWMTAGIAHALSIGVTPVVFGDVSMDRQMGVSISSTEDEFLYLANAFRPRRVVMATRVDGVLDREGRVVPGITSESFPSIRNVLLPAEGEDVTGGMLHKVERLLQLAAAGCETLIVNALVPGRLKDAVLGDPVVGTRIGF
jgi:isopentenyl phosphate kinase